MIKKMLIIFLGILPLQIFSQKNVTQLPIAEEIKFVNPTFFYTLPQTAFKVDIVIQKNTSIRGVYADYAEKMLGITNFYKENSASFQLLDLVVTPFTIPDNTLQFVAELSNMQVKNNFLQELYTKIPPTRLHPFSSEQNSEENSPAFTNRFADVITQQTTETYTETKIINGVVTQVPITQTKTITKTTLQQAQSAADFIEKIRDDRYSILSLAQETTLEKEAFEYLINQLNALEKHYIELFTGSVKVENIYETLIVFPNNTSALQPIFSLSKEEGFSTSMSKANVYNYYFKYSHHPTKEQQEDLYKKIDANSGKKITGYRIRKAVPAIVSLVRSDIEVAKLGVYPVFQFGILKTLPPNLDTFEIGEWGYVY
ncbi:MAG: DUF4831 family protein [Firmicutes bacterium]|nr:DUF4831 family protein [Bacillota bacterium]